MFLCYDYDMKEYKETTSTTLLKSLSDLTIYNAGYEECEANQGYGPTYREYTLLHFVLEGEGTLTIDQHKFQIHKGDLFVIPAHKVAYYQASAHHPWCYAWIGYLGIHAETYTHQLLHKASDIYVIHNLNVISYYERIQSIINATGSETSLYLKTNGQLLSLIAQLFEELQIQEDPKSVSTLSDEIKHYIDLNYPEDIRINDIAHLFHIHPNYLSRIFQEKYHSSPKQYILNLKIKKACELLLKSNHPISVIANAIGFKDQLAFSKLFKKTMGLSPSAYKQLYGQTIERNEMSSIEDE